MRADPQCPSNSSPPEPKCPGGEATPVVRGELKIGRNGEYCCGEVGKLPMLQQFAKRQITS